MRLGATFVLGLFAAYVGCSLLAAHIFATALRLPPNGNPRANAGLAYEEVRFPARSDGVQIAAWHIPAEGDRALILVHGINGCRNCMMGNASSFISEMHRRGYSILMLDLRGHGASGAAYTTFGLRERRDIEGGVDWLRARGFAPGRIGLYGVSLGAASSVGAAADEPAIAALVIDSAFADVYSVIEQQLPLPGFLVPSTVFFGQFLVGEDVRRARPVDEIARIAPRPVLIIHAAGDDYIPVAHAQRLAAAYPAAQLWVVQARGHVSAYRRNSRTYIERVADFFDAALP